MKHLFTTLLNSLRRRPNPAATEHELSAGERVARAALLHAEGVNAITAAREILIPTYSSYNRDSDAALAQRVLQSRIEAALQRYRSDPNIYKYFYGHPYQGLAVAGIFGDRICDYRFDDYELRRFVRPDDRVLDIGCNCGFMAILASYRIGCHSHGIDINPYMIEIGRLVAEHLRLSDLVSLEAGRLEHHRPSLPYDVVLSFATHWTDDENYRVGLDAHMTRMAGLLRQGGTLLFESHCNDVGQPEFYAAMEMAREHFSFDGLYKRTDSDTRELYVLRRH